MTAGVALEITGATGVVLLVGTAGSGKSTFAVRAFAPTEVLSSDHLRGVVADDPADQSATVDAFDVLHRVLEHRLRRRLLTVVDATNLEAPHRAELVRRAAGAGLGAVAIVFDVAAEVCVARDAGRGAARVGAEVIGRQRRLLDASLRSLGSEGFRAVHVLRGPEDAVRVDVVRTSAAPAADPSPRFDLREETGPFDVVGDVHGCRPELESLLGALGYEVLRDDDGRPVDAVPPAGRTAVFVGDLVDRGPDSPGVLRLVSGMVAAGHALCVAGNHEEKLLRALGGRGNASHGLQLTLDQLAAAETAEPGTREGVAAFCRSLPHHLVLDDGRLVIAHAGLREDLQGRDSGRVRSFALYGDTTGEVDADGLPIRRPWQNDYRGEAVVLYGHTPAAAHEWVNNTLCLDTGCVFGGRLTALRYPEREIVSVPAEREWFAPRRPLARPAGDVMTS